MDYFLFFLLSLGLSILLVKPVIRLAVKYKIYDLPNHPRKIHSAPVPFLGGLAVYFSFLLTTLAYIYFKQPNFEVVPVKFFVGIFLGGLILTVGGFLDDKFTLPPKISWIFPGLASLAIVFSGIGVGIKEISNPFGSPFSLNYEFFNLPLSGIVMWLWLMGMIFTTKFLDGLDGLCAGISFIGGITLFVLSLTENVNQPITASLAIIFSGSVLGFLFFNFNPASIFLGESGSTFLGFMLGVLSIILGGKIATALLVMGIPILDVAWAIIRRLWYKTSPFKADRSHLHHRLMDIGLSQKQAVLALYGISAFFGFTAVFLQSLGKLIALIMLFCVMLALAISAVIIYKKQHPHIPDLFDKIKS